jgi:hypothetical protein
MSSQDRKQADARLAEGLAAHCAADARETYRNRLRALKAENADAFTRASRYYEERVVPRLLAESDPLDAWIDYGRVIGELTGTGRLMVIDASGKSAAYEPPLAPGQMVMFVPDDTRYGSFAAIQPMELSAAQRATLGLLVEGRLSL